MILPRKAQVAIWYYKDNVRNYPGFHMTVGSTACQWLSAVLAGNSFNFIELSLIPASTSILAVPNNKRNTARHVDFTYSRMTLDEGQREEIRIANNHPRIRIVLNSAGKDALLRGVIPTVISYDTSAH